MCVRKIWALILASAANQLSDLKAGNIVSETQFPQLELREVAGQEERGYVRSLSPPPLPPPVPPSLPPISTPICRAVMIETPDPKELRKLSAAHEN